MHKEHIGYRPVWTIEKFASEDDHKAGVPYETLVQPGNLLLNEGIAAVLDLIAGLASPTPFNNANARLGVGDSATAEAATQTDLQAAVNKAYGAMAGGYPQRTAQTLRWQTSFSGVQANFAWNEMCVDNGAGVTLNRKVSNQGTKTAGQVWVVYLDITLG